MSGGTANSPDFVPAALGTYCYRADYTGQGNYLSSSDSSVRECFAVHKADSATTTTPADSTIQIGATTSDSAAVTGNATGGTPTGMRQLLGLRSAGLGVRLRRRRRHRARDLDAEWWQRRQPELHADRSRYLLLPGELRRRLQLPGLGRRLGERVLHRDSGRQHDDLDAGRQLDPARRRDPRLGGGDRQRDRRHADGQRQLLGLRAAELRRRAVRVAAPSLGGATLNGGTATGPSFTPGALGTYCYRADYVGGGNYLASSDGSAGECFTVTQANSATISTPGDSSIQLAGSTSDSVTVTGNATGGTPTGSVSFSVCGPLSSASGCGSGGTSLGTASLSGGSATEPELHADRVGDLLLPRRLLG